MRSQKVSDSYLRSVIFDSCFYMTIYVCVGYPRPSDERLGETSPIAEEMDNDQDLGKLSGASVLTQDQPSDAESMMGIGGQPSDSQSRFRPHAAEDDVSHDAYSSSGGDDIQQLSGASGSFRAPSAYGRPSDGGAQPMQGNICYM